MKIKRFEASSMSDALRKIKKEFGQEAVILSAKTMKKGSRLLGNKRSDQVVVTAAIDKRPSCAPVAVAGDAPETVGTEDSPAAFQERNYSKFSILEKFNPITRTGRKKVKPKINEWMNRSSDEKTGDRLSRHLRAQGVSEHIAVDLESKATDLSPNAGRMGKDAPSALSQVIEAMGIVGRRRPAGGTKPRIAVMVGPSGAGKTAAVVKLAAKHAMNYRERVGIITLDNRRVAGAVELERYAALLDITLRNAANPEETADALNKMSALDLVVVDTPGLTPDDQILRERLRRSLAVFKTAEIYLLLSAVVKEDVSRRMIRFFRPLDPHGLFYTQLDWTPASGEMINQSIGTGLPISFLSDSAKVPEGIHTATADELAALLLPKDSTAGAAEAEDDVTVVHNVKRSSSEGFVANRNSDIFHRDNCKSVKRINTRNMIIFKDSAEAMGQRFKPCRMCCNTLLTTKILDRPARGYAGYRCSNQ